MFLNSIEIESIDSCMADISSVRISGVFSRNISPVMPYLNSILKKGIYNHSVPSLTFTDDRKLITLFDDKLFIGKLTNETEAFQILSRLKEWINDVYENRDSIVPDYKLKKRPSALEIYSLLPQTNCRKCGDKTCLAFSTRLLLGEQELRNCIPLYQREFERNKLTLEELLK